MSIFNRIKTASIKDKEIQNKIQKVNKIKTVINSKTLRIQATAKIKKREPIL